MIFNRHICGNLGLSEGNTNCGNQLDTELQKGELERTAENIASYQVNDLIFKEETLSFVDQNSNYYKKKWENVNPKKPY